eukprot:RCo030920
MPQDDRSDKVGPHVIRKLETIFNNLKSRQEDVREHAAVELRRTLEAQIKATPGEALAPLEKMVNIKLFELFRAPTDERMGGLRALQALIDLDFVEHTVKVARFIGFITICFPTNSNKQAQLAAHVLGKLARMGGALATDVVESEAKRALEWLISGKDVMNRRYCALLILRELTQSVPSLLFQRVEQFLEAVWTALRDPSLAMREAAVLALRAYLVVIADRDSPLRPSLYDRIYHNALKGLKGKPESQHGSLLVLGELLKFTKDDFMKQKFRETCDTILKYKDHKVPVIRVVVLRLLPRLADFQPTVFRTHYLHEVIHHLFSMLKAGSVSQPGDRENAYLALGDLAQAMGRSLLTVSSCSIDALVTIIRTGLHSTTHKGGKDGVANAALECLSRLCQSCTQDMLPHIIALLDPVFSLGLSPELTTALAKICEAMPNLLSTVQDMLLDTISRILAEVPYYPPGSIGRAQLKPEPMHEAEDKVALLLLALSTLGTFDMKNHPLCDFVRDNVMQYFYHDLPAVRRQAVLTACFIMKSSVELYYGRIFPAVFAPLSMA